MLNILQYPNINFKTFSEGLVADNCPIAVGYSLSNKLPESPYVTPKYRQQYISPSGKNRYLTSVTVGRIPVVSSTVDLAVGAVMTVTFYGTTSVVSSTPATATATINGGVVTVTGVAAGTTTVTVYDNSNNVIGTVVVTVA